MSDHDKFQMWDRAVRVTAAQKFSKDLIGVLFAAPAELDFNDPDWGFRKCPRSQLDVQTISICTSLVRGLHCQNRMMEK